MGNHSISIKKKIAKPSIQSWRKYVGFVNGMSNDD
jgi:hypothetical protein